MPKRCVDTDLRSIAEAVVPEARAMNEAEWRAFDQVIDGVLSRRPAAMRRQLGLLLRIVNLFSLIRYRRSFSKLTNAQRTTLLSSLQDSPVLVLRRGFWGLRTLVFMGYYAQPERATALGYAAHPRGWEQRR